jgi:hypothetical protein
MGTGTVFRASIRDSEDTQIENNKLSTQRVSGFCLSIVAMPSQLYNLPFGIPLSLPQCFTDRPRGDARLPGGLTYYLVS